MALCASIALHGVFFLALPTGSGEKQALETLVELVPAILPESAPPPILAESNDPSMDVMRVVESDVVGADAEEPVHSRFLGAANQKVEKETRAARVDRFQKALGPQGGSAGLADASPQSEGDSTGTKGLEGLSMNDLVQGDDAPVSFGRTASTDDGLDNVERGDHTALNTREFRYHSFYVRVKDQLREQWKPEAEARTRRLWATNVPLPRRDLVTRVVAVLDRQGRVVRTEQVHGSGAASVDEVAHLAFRQVGVFPNPPRQMVGTDGFVRLNWEFVVHGGGSRPLPIAQTEEPTSVEERGPSRNL